MQTRRHRLRTNGQAGFTLIELMVVILIISLLVGILIPTLSGARDKAKRLVCQTYLKDIGTAMTDYLRTSNDRFPDSDFY